jgi:hypothetical protein
MSGLVLPQYATNADYTQQEYYQQELNTRLLQWFNANGFANATLTQAQVQAVLTLPNPPPIGTRWYNITLDKEQFIGAKGVQTITSSY